MKYKISDIAEINKKNINKNYKGKVFYLDTSSVTNDFFNCPKIYTSLKEAPIRARRLAEDGDTIISTVRPAMRHVGYISQNLNRVYSTGFAIISPKKSKVNPFYLYLVLSSKEITNLLQSIAVGSTSAYPSIKPRDIGNLIFDFPSLCIQEKIASIMQQIILKIKMNNQINDNLTSQIKSISNNYFHLFKHYLYKNWAYVKLEDIAEINSGYSYQGQELLPSNIAMATIKNFNRTGGFNVNGYKEIKPRKNLKTEKYANLFDVLIAHTDITQNGDIIGNAEIILDTCNYKNVIYSMDLVKVTPKNQLISPFLLALLLQSNELKKYCLGYVNGTTVLHLNKKAIKNFRIPLPNNISDINNIEKYARYAYKQMSINFKENRILKSLKTEILNKYF